MSDVVSSRPDPERYRLLQSAFEIASLADVADAIAEATHNETHVYVERMATGWRWSLAHRGGGYPLLRITARFLKVDHHRIMVPFRTVGDGWAILCRDPRHPSKPATSTIVEFAGPTSAEDVRTRLIAALGP